MKRQQLEPGSTLNYNYGVNRPDKAQRRIIWLFAAAEGQQKSLDFNHGHETVLSVNQD